MGAVAEEARAPSAEAERGTVDEARLKALIAEAVKEALTVVRDEEVEYGIVVALGNPGDTGLLSGLKELGKDGWHAFAFAPGEVKVTLLAGKQQSWKVYVWRTKRLVEIETRLPVTPPPGAG